MKNFNSNIKKTNLMLLITVLTVMMALAVLSAFTYKTHAKLAEYTVFFNANGGEVSPESKTVYEGDTYGELTTPTREGATFVGWYADEDLTESFDFSKPITEYTEVYAKYEIIDGANQTYIIGSS